MQVTLFNFRCAWINIHNVIQRLEIRTMGRGAIRDVDTSIRDTLVLIRQIFTTLFVKHWHFIRDTFVPVTLTLHIWHFDNFICGTMTPHTWHFDTSIPDTLTTSTSDTLIVRLWHLHVWHMYISYVTLWPLHTCHIDTSCMIFRPFPNWHYDTS